MNQPPSSKARGRRLTPDEKAIAWIAKELAAFFSDDPKKITLWLFTPNFNFGMTPAVLIQARPIKAAKIIKGMRNGDFP